MTQETSRPPFRSMTPDNPGVGPEVLSYSGPVELGRQVGTAFRDAPANQGRVARLRALLPLGLTGFDPADRFGRGYRVYCALAGEPLDGDDRWGYPLDHVPAEVVDFWLAQIPQAGTETVAMMLADDATFADAFVAAVTA